MNSKGKNKVQIPGIENDERNISFFRWGLESAGHRVEWVMTGSAAHEALDQRSSAYSAIIIDWHLGPENGLEICREFPARRVETPIIIVPDECDRELESFQAGPNAFLPEPFGREELLEQIHKHTPSGRFWWEENDRGRNGLAGIIQEITCNGCEVLG